MQNVPEWLGEVIALVTENRDANRTFLERLNQHEALLTERQGKLEAIDEHLRNKALVLADQQQALINAVSDLKEFANSIYGPQSAIAQINTKLDGIQQTINNDRATNERTFRELRQELQDLRESYKERFVAIEQRLADLERARA